MTYRHCVLCSLAVFGLAIVLNSCELEPAAQSVNRTSEVVSVDPRLSVDIQMVAQFQPGRALQSGWTVVISGQGRVTLEMWQTGEFSEDTLTVDDLNSLTATVDEVQFMTLRLVGQAVVDAPKLTLYAIRGGRFHTEHVLVTPELGSDPEVERFLKVWRTVEALAAPPNSGL